MKFLSRFHFLLSTGLGNSGAGKGGGGGESLLESSLSEPESLSSESSLEELALSSCTDIPDLLVELRSKTDQLLIRDGATHRI